MYPHERSLVKRLRDKPFALIGVNSDDDRDHIRRVVEKKGITWRSFWDGGTDGPISTRWGINVWPSIFVIDAKGVIRARDLRGDDLDAAVDELLAELEGS